MSLSPIEESCRRSLRSVRWRIDLGILPSSPVASVDDLRRASADSRRRYATLRRKLLINPQLIKDEDSCSDPSIDNPLSQNPESMWGKYFRNAELESTIDQDLTRLYGNSYFQTASCQFILKRILLLWGLQHPHYNYRQGMHELLAPLVYVLHIDQMHLKTLQKLHSNLFTENFEEESLFSPQTLKNTKNGFPIPKATTFDDLDPEKKQIILLTDLYGSEGELGVVLSEKFMEHDAYSMFDGLMDGGNNYSVSMAEFFSSSNSSVKIPILPPVIEASSALYHLLSLVDHSLHSHLIELGVEPQYFALRWLRVLFGREFELENLLLIWDEIFSYDNKKESNSSSTEIDAFRVLSSDRGAFIASFAVSMILHLRPALLATENVTICLQKLLNFPSNVEIHNLLQKSKDLFKTATSSKVHHHNEGSNNKTPPHHSVPSNYWEEKWRVLHKTESLPLPIENKSGNKSNMDSVHGGPTKKKSLRERFGLSRAGSDGNSSKRRLFDEVEKTEGLNANSPCKSENVTINNSRILENNNNNDDDGIVRVSNSVPNYVRSNMKEIVASESVRGEDNSSSSSSCSVSNERESIERENFENDTDKSSVTSNSFLCEIVEIEGVLCKNGEEEKEEEHIVEEDGREKDEIEVVKEKEKGKEIEKGKGDGVLKESRSAKFGWFWKFGKGDNNNNNNNNNSNNNNNLVINEGGETKIEKESSNSNSMSNPDSSSTNSNSHSSSKINPDFNHNANSNSNSNSDSKSYTGGNSVKPENSGDKKVTGTFKNLGQSMLDNIQVIESVFQQDRGKGQATAMAALTELRKISNLLREI